MLDNQLLFYNNQAVTTNGNSAALDVKKTNVDGFAVGVAVKAVSGTSPTLTLSVQESDDGSAYNTIYTFPQFTGASAGAYVVAKVQSKKRYLRLAATVGGTSPSFTVHAGIVSGGERNSFA